MAIVNTISPGVPKKKLDDHGTTCMWLGYSNDHASDVYQWLNVKTKKVIESKQVSKWLNKNYGQYMGLCNADYGTLAKIEEGK